MNANYTPQSIADALSALQSVTNTMSERYPNVTDERRGAIIATAQKSFDLMIAELEGEEVLACMSMHMALYRIATTLKKA